MANLKELRTRIASVQATRKITRAMQMVAASRLRHAQEATLAVRPYVERLDGVLRRLHGHSPLLRPTELQEKLQDGSQKPVLLVVMTASRGLCGGFNSAITRLARRRARDLKRQGKDIALLCVGRKGYEALRREWGEHIPVLAPHPTFATGREIANRILEEFAQGHFDRAELFSARFVSVITQTPVREQLIPLCEEAPPPHSAPYEMEPEEQALLEDLLPHALAVRLFYALLENAAGEQGARMSAMDAATRNAAEMIDGLTLLYNRTRQAMITRELIEIISGAEAL